MQASKANVLKWAERASDSDIVAGLTWYDDVRAFCSALSHEFEIPTADVAAAFSALSPRISVAMNFTACLQVVSAAAIGKGAHALPTVAGIRTNVDKAHAIIWSGWESVDWTNSPKTWAFFQNIIDPNSADVTVDVWAERVAYDDPTFRATGGAAGKHYADVANAYLEAAIELDIDVVQLQAITWISIRGSAS